MKIISLTAEEIRFIAPQQRVVDSLESINIELPEGLIIKNLEVSIQIVSSSPSFIEGQFLTEATFNVIDESVRMILQAYIQYREHERKIDEQLGIDTLVEVIQKSTDQFWDQVSVARHIYSGLTSVSAH